MKVALRHEMRKLFCSKGFNIAIAISMLFAVSHFFYTVNYVNRVYYSYADSVVHPCGLDNISLLYRFIGCDIYSVFGTIFTLILPIISALPFSDSLFKERKIGYNIHVISRVGKKNYLSAKFIAVFFSGFSIVFLLLVVDIILCACICPLTSVHILTLQTSMHQGHFLVEWFYNHHVLFLMACIVMISIWGGVCAVLALASELFLKNAIMIILFSFAMLYFLSFLMEYLSGVFLHTVYEVRVNSLFSAMCLNRNPAWYIAVWQVVLLVIAWIVYCRKEMKHENF